MFLRRLCYTHIMQAIHLINPIFQRLAQWLCIELRRKTWVTYTCIGHKCFLCRYTLHRCCCFFANVLFTLHYPCRQGSQHSSAVCHFVKPSTLGVGNPGTRVLLSWLSSSYPCPINCCYAGIAGKETGQWHLTIMVANHFNTQNTSRFDRDLVELRCLWNRGDIVTTVINSL